MKRILRSLVLIGAALSLLAANTGSAASSERGVERLAERVRHQIAMLPYYGVFDHIVFRVEGDTIQLMGAVSRPTLAADAARVAASVEGVGAVQNHIEVLPLSPMDDEIRLRMFAAIYGNPMMRSYAMASRGPIRIIVNRGNVTLEGVVDSTMDSTLAYTAARHTPGAFSVTNNLRVLQAAR